MAQAGADGFRGLAEIPKQCLGRKSGQLGLAGKQSVGIVHIRLMMLKDLHGERVDLAEDTP